MTAASSSSTAAPTGPVLYTDKLVKTFALGFFRKKVEAVRDVGFAVQRGEIFGLLGPNGAGKTTTLKVLMGLVKPTAGAATVFGLPPSDRTARQRLGYLPESPYFYDYLSGRELLVLVGELCGLSRRDARTRAGALLERVGLDDAGDRAMRRYSKGMLQRVGLAQALVNEPQLVVLDEPLSGLDPIGRKQLRELIAELRQEGRTVLFSSHIISDVELLADRVTIIVRGKTVATGSVDELVDARVLATEVVAQTPESDDELHAALEAAGHSSARIGDRLRIEQLGDDAVDPLIDLLREHGARILSVTPRKESLEDLVVRRAEDGEASAAQEADDA
jgi:ABC-2 type transport system ATP-binding protein